MYHNYVSTETTAPPAPTFEPMIIAARARQEIANRASRLGAERFLLVHYYRIRKRLAVPLPITDSLPQAYAVRNFSSPYPWAIWLKWALEDRMLALGEYVCQTGNAAARTAVEADLSALAAWKSYREAA